MIKNRMDDIMQWSKEEIEIRKNWQKFLREAREMAKVTQCMWCGQETTSFCNSHTVPRTFLKNISKKSSEYRCGYQLYEPRYEKEKLGLNEAGTFKMLCKQCDANVFKDYEEEAKILEFKDQESIMAQIAFKSTVRKLHDALIALSQMLHGLERKACERQVTEIESVTRYYAALTECYNNELNRIGPMINKDDVNRKKYKLIFRKILDHVVPIAIQSSILIFNDINDEDIKHNSEIPIQPMHIVVFPLEQKSLIMMFVHEEDHVYDNLILQFNDRTEEEKLIIINYWMFKYSDEFLIGESIDVSKLDSNFIKEITPSKEKINAGILRMDEYPNFFDHKLKICGSI